MKAREGEVGRQRRKSISGRLLHCCCVCGKLDRWGDGWSWFGSIKDFESCDPLPKFCSAKCRNKAGKLAEKITDEIKRAAAQKEWREPDRCYRQRTYADACTEQESGGGS